MSADLLERTTPAAAPAVTARWRPGFGAKVFAACQAVLLCWWAALYPGVMSPDSASSVWRVAAGHWEANASVLYDAFTWLSLRATGGIAGLTLAQTVLLAGALAYAAVTLRALGVPPRWAAAAAIALTVLPASGALAVTLWKDAPFAVCSVLAFTTLARLVGGLGGRDRLVALLGVELLAMALLRNNAFLMVAIATVLLVVLLPGLRLRLAAAGGAAVAVWALLYTVVYPALGVGSASVAVAFAPAYADLAQAYRYFPDTFTKKDEAVLASVAPLSAWRSSSCYSVDSLVYRPGFSWKEAVLRNDELVGLWGKAVRRDPGIIASTRLCRGSVAWSPLPGDREQGGYSYKYSPRIPADVWRIDARGEQAKLAPYRDGLHYRPLLEPLTAAARFFRDLTLVRQFEAPLWRGAFWAYVAYGALYLTARRRGGGRRWWALGAVVAGQQLGVLLTTPAQDARYMAGPLLVGVLCLPLLFLRRGRD